MRIILQQDITIKPTKEKVYIDSLSKVVEFKKYYKPYDKKNMDFSSDLQRDFSSNGLQEDKRIPKFMKNLRQNSNSNRQQNQMFFGKSKYSFSNTQLMSPINNQKKVGLQQQEEYKTLEIDSLIQRQNSQDVFEQYFRFNVPVSDQPETKMSKRRRHQKQQSIFEQQQLQMQLSSQNFNQLNSINNSQSPLKNLQNSKISSLLQTSSIVVEDPSAHHNSQTSFNFNKYTRELEIKNMAQQSMKKSQSSFLPQIYSSSSKNISKLSNNFESTKFNPIINVGFDNPYAYRQQFPIQETLDINLRRKNLNVKLQKLGKAQKEYESIKLRQKLQFNKDMHNKQNNQSKMFNNSDDELEKEYLAATNKNLDAISTNRTLNNLSKEDLKKLKQKRKQEKEDLEKLNYLFQKYSQENLQKYVGQLNQMPYVDVLEILEKDLNVSAQLLVSFQDNSYVIQQLEEIHTFLAQLQIKKKKEKDLFDKIQMEERKEQSLFEKARSFNPKVVDQQLQTHTDQQILSAVQQLEVMNKGIKSILDNYGGLKKYYDNFEQELQEPIPDRNKEQITNPIKGQEKSL